ncbi:SAM-dependent MidA family methyltransferase [Paenibacillus cellulosilyticus]|uniref:SAM-dependent MidA family methyltransferase n=1 Tax=Paenibacillus cellulosilyticus TaxID=375489 RepID=A0A2V2YM67_9BACL|nr:SAM-dependent methyltransferase [Paenibacillus cellulosilyticus]PWV95449.1 SAM-dependent MidA family methyltransferase [Paenibacillus cellulosilyticus]QKS43176.1 SAM-dependent methyltransferase [Paenibacillus cellulosilyticus]
MDKLIHRLSSRIAAIIEQEGVPAETREGAVCKAIPFSRYMELCLYDEHEGYYRSGSIRTGRQGDFYTSGAIGGIMGQMLARYIQGAVEGNRGFSLIAEWGAGAGAITSQMLETWRDHSLDWLQTIDYGVVDDHPRHLEAAKERLDCLLGHERGAGTRSISFYNSEEAAAAVRKFGAAQHVIIFANELIDAMPVHRVVLREGELVELGVCHVETARDISFGWSYMPLSSKAIADSIEADGVTMLEGQETEINLVAEQWLEMIGEIVNSGMLILIDYGHSAAEYRASYRMQGTLMCYKQHLAHDNPFVSPGVQDITAHVNFTALRRAAERAGWKVAEETTQLQFLMDQGILDLLRSHQDRDPFSETSKRNRAIRQLLLSDGMSETFKVLVLTKGEFIIQRIQKQPESV